MRAIRKIIALALLELPGLVNPWCAEATGPVPASLAGSWQVVKQVSSGLSAPRQGKGEQWIGKRAAYASEVAKFDSMSCAKPTYTADRVNAATFLSGGFHVLPQQLGIKEKDIDIVTVTCAGEDWIAPGSLLIVTGPRQLLTFWDGVFIEMAAVGNDQPQRSATGSRGGAKASAKPSSRRGKAAKG